MRVSALSPDCAPTARGTSATEVRPFRQVRFPEHDRPRRPQALHDEGVLEGPGHGEGEGASGRPFVARGVDVVFHEHRNAV